MYQISEALKQKIDSLPLLPGCYKYFDKDRNLIYVGKAVKLRNRVKSYFSNYERLEPHTQRLIENISDLEFVTVDSEIEALLLETNLIKKFRPKFNRLMIDDKNYIWIKITVSEDFPRIKLVREIKSDHDEYFGPYPSSFPAKEVIKKLRKVFNYRSCNRKMYTLIDFKELKTDNKIEIQRQEKIICSDTKPCLYYHIGLCKAPCASKISKLEYRKSINNIIRFFRGQKIDILTELETEMKIAAKLHQFERASVLRDRAENIRYVLARMKVKDDVDDISIIEIQKKSRELAGLEIYEKVIKPQSLDVDFDMNNYKFECYDISNIQGTNPVGAMTVVVNGQARPDMYKKFKINGKNTPDDFAMHKEMLKRRLNAYISSQDERNFQGKNDTWKLPDLLIIDGGKAQLSSDYEVLKELSLDSKIPICGLAKREEEIIILNPDFDPEKDISVVNERFRTIRLSKRSEGLKLFQRIRDEAHRFGINYHRKLRSKDFLNKTSINNKHDTKNKS